jgi:hypothetical protein
VNRNAFVLASLGAASVALLLTAPDATAGAKASRASVKGKYTDDNAGELTVVDGVAWRSLSAGGTVVDLTTRPIASAVLGSTCPVTEARALILLSDAAWVEVIPDAAGRSKFFTWGRTFGDSRGSRVGDMGDNQWTIKLRKAPPATIAGEVVYADHGSFDFELPVRQPSVAETSGAESYDDGPREVPGTPAAVAAFRAAYQAVRAAALKRDLPAFLAAQGFDASQIAAIRALPEVDADFARLARRFLTTEKLGKPAFKGRRGSMTASGTNAEGKAFYNWYYLTSCGPGRHLLTTMAENPQ